MARILVVDDTPQNLALVELYLRGSEFEVTAASGGAEALELCAHQAFALILLDVVMPGIDGFEVCRRLKNDPRTAFVPVIFLTGHLADESEKFAAYQIGAVDYLQKPIHKEELLARMRVMLRLEETRSRLDRENATLRAELAAAERQVGELERRRVQMLELRREVQSCEGAGALVLDAAGALLAMDEAAQATFGSLPLGQPLGAGSGAGALAAQALAQGLAQRPMPSDVELRTPLPRVLQVETVRLPGSQQRLVTLFDVTALRAAERHLVDREPAETQMAEPPAPSPGPAAPPRYAMSEFVGRSASVRDLTVLVDRLRQSRSTVLIYGESGTGKELVARALHFDGQNRSAPFIPLHCGAIAPELVESELFGHEKGAFTGAQQARDGLFRAADGGTIFLDEIAELSPAVQVKLLRVLQRGEIRPVGASLSQVVDVRILAATNRDLLQMVRAGQFREDLYYRLEVVTVHLPPLRERLDDLPLLVEHFLRAGNRRHDRLARPVRGVSRAALALLMAYPWPGNVRELENVVDRAFALGVGELLQAEDLPPRVRAGTPELVPKPVWRTAESEPDGLPPSAMPAPALAAAPPALLPAESQPAANCDVRTLRQDAERQAFLRAIRDCAGDNTAAARALGVPRSTFYRRLKELGLRA
ncbi:MAG: sigma-54-dependent Fis family transcriptional regulator [Planctomycetes bacterium]|nr:sigma-54-dependent Fis family transcriptional regulator [Planctomycetota bacterium]